MGFAVAAEEPDECFDRLEFAPNKSAVLAKLTPHQLHGCLALAAQRVEQSRHQAVLDLDAELDEEFPRRDVRGFLIVRVRDAREGTKPRPAGRAKRTAQLTVWRPEELGDGFLRVGGRYHVGVVVPKGTWRRTTEEITLTTRRDTRWSVFGGE